MRRKKKKKSRRGKLEGGEGKGQSRVGGVGEGKNAKRFGLGKFVVRLVFSMLLLFLFLFFVIFKNIVIFVASIIYI